MKKQLDISTDLGQKRFEENVALLARAEKAEAEEKEWREIAETLFDDYVDKLPNDRIDADLCDAYRALTQRYTNDVGDKKDGE